MSHRGMSVSEVNAAAEKIWMGGGLLFPLHHGYEQLGELLKAAPTEAWRHDEAVLGGWVLYLVNHGQATRAKSYLNAHNLTFEPTHIIGVLDLLLALHLGEPVSAEKLTAWRRLERALPIAEPLLQGLHYNSMLAMFVRLLRTDDARVAGQQAISCYREAGHVYLEHFIHIHLADLDVMEGRLRRAARGLKTAERCLASSGVRYGNEDEVIGIIRLAIDYEHGRLDHVRRHAPALRNSLMTGDAAGPRRTSDRIVSRTPGRLFGHQFQPQFRPVRARQCGPYTVGQTDSTRCERQLCCAQETAGARLQLPTVTGRRSVAIGLIQ